jgi:hypothetical protein
MAKRPCVYTLTGDTPMPNTVNNPPALIAQQASGWCYVAAELMARIYYGFPVDTQYNIARRSVIALANVPVPEIRTAWLNATAADYASGQDEQNGANLASARVDVVRTQWGAINYDAIGGYIVTDCSQQDFRDDIAQNKIVIIGNALHYYVVYGYDDSKDFTLLVRDPWPPGGGGQTTTIPYNTFVGWGTDRLIIRFRQAPAGST